MNRLATPILLIGDNPGAPGGLSRIGRDLATLASTMPEFRVGYLARGMGNKRAFPFTVYAHPENDWGQSIIEEVWRDFSGGESGVIMTTDDASRRGWFANPQMYGSLATFLGDGRNFQKWGYFPVDSWGPTGSFTSGQFLGIESRMAVAGYDRVIAASEWGRDCLVNGGRTDADWLPHGIGDRFKVADGNAGVRMLGWDPSHIHVGCVMANQARKDYPAAFECAAALKAEYGNRFRFWLHTDTMVRHWNVYALAQDYGVADCIEVTTELADEQLALRYSACDCTILPSGGEGFGYPVAESLSCGTACIVADYAAAQELVHEDCRVRPVAYRIETIHNVRRAVLSGYGFAVAAKGEIEKKRADWEFRSGELRESVAHLGWGRLRHVWERWFREGIRQ